MAIVRVEIAKREQSVREAIIADITEVMVRHGAHSEGTQVIITEIEMTHWGKGGVPFSKRAHVAPPATADGQATVPQQGGA